MVLCSKKLGDWVKGPITLGANNSYLHLESGAKFDTGRAYECGAIISVQFNPHDPPDDLADLLRVAFQYYDQTLLRESNYIESAMPQVSENEWAEQVNAAIIGRKAEGYVSRSWFHASHPEWGRMVDKTESTGLGYDFQFPDAELFVEVKGFGGEIDCDPTN